MTPESAFLQAIIETPDDDFVRLIYADFLEENGQSDRSEFIRVQIELANLPDPAKFGRQVGRMFLCEQCRWVGECEVGGGNKCGRCGSEHVRKWRNKDEIGRRFNDLSTREGDLLNEHAHLWLPTVFDRTLDWGSFMRRGTTLIVPIGYDNWSFEFRRGFVEAAGLPLASWVRFGKTLVRTLPLGHVENTGVLPLMHIGPPPNCWMWNEVRLDRDLHAIGQQVMEDEVQRNAYSGDVMLRMMSLRERIIYHVRDRRFESRDAGLKAMSDALLEWARVEPAKVGA